MRVGIVILPEHRWWAAEPLWRMAEEYGFDHAWTYDHVGWRELVDKPWFDAVPTLTAAATVTSRIKLGTLVSSPNFRHPVHFTREVTALDDVSDGRFLLGLGAGSPGFDARVFGARPLSAGRRSARFAEFVELLDGILTSDSTDFHGTYYTAVEARRAPGCVQTPRVPFVVAAEGSNSMRVAARFGNGWLTTGRPPGTEVTESAAWWRGLRDNTERFDEALHEQGRVPGRVPRYLNADAGPSYALSSVEHFRDVLGRASELGFTDVLVHWPRTEAPFEGRESILEEVANEVLPGLKER
ncbi:LLM class flavin-dependent oxidoreductase [Actinopolyspora mortivallis]|uniref:LLM class flavin-dependent oxidoreductase n=1 Tax=Actinopolyspora mortivallis TaxID=33906 RepID=A0A2T0GVG1_ACTMO|nr:LLM class flavin-dependent oxidoreductase [Actinopolyspora mortivallis]PRW63003.1 LLM class flavin-dependent oxidoreductase [Actinopolyspora mortivallis]